MIDPEKIPCLTQKKFHGRSEKNPWSIQQNSMADPKKMHSQSRNKSMIDPEKIRGRFIKNPLSIQKNFMVDSEKNDG